MLQEVMHWFLVLDVVVIHWFLVSGVVMVLFAIGIGVSYLIVDGIKQAKQDRCGTHWLW